jgi:plastocyanin
MRAPRRGRCCSGLKPGRSAPLGALLAVVLLSCGGAGPEATELIMLDNTFAPQVVRVPVGGTLRIENRGRNPHNAIAVDGSWSTETATGRVDMPGGEYAELRFDETGRFPFYCSFHATPDGRRGMVGVLVVGDAIGEDIVRADDSPEPTSEPSGRTLRVPGEFMTVQEGVDAAQPGDLVLVGPGVYREQVTVTTPSIVIRGTDRNTVVLDGEFQRVNGIEVLAADGVAVENLTARNYLLNGFYWTGVTGYRASYVTAYNNEDYGLYAFDSRDGVFEYSYASGSPDAGFYIGQCYPCDAIINGVIAEGNALGYSGTNAGGELYIVSSIWRNNKSGIVPNTLDTELLPPERETTIVGNLIASNNNHAAPAKRLQYPTIGNGIVIAGGVRNRIERNVIVDHAEHGVLVAPNLDAHFWFAIGNVVRNNLIRGSGRADLALMGPAGPGNCFEGNGALRTFPPGLELAHRCTGARLPWVGDLSSTARMLGFYSQGQRGSFPRGEVADQPAPPPQPQLPGGSEAPVRPAHGVFASYGDVNVGDLASIPLPAEAAALSTPSRAPEVHVAGLTVTQPTFVHVLFGMYAYLLPFVLLAAWYAVAFWDLARRTDLSRGFALGWIVAILLVPFAGVVLYLFASRSAIALWLRLAFVAGGVASYLIIVVIAAMVGGII